jgi:hypothetical protein
MKNYLQKSVIVAAMIILTASCVSKKPAAKYVSNPDYNERIEVEKPYYKKRANGFGITVAVVLPAGGAVAGYFATPVRTQDGDQLKKSRAGGMVAGALVGAGIAYFTGRIAGYGKTVEVKDVNEWIRKANPEYKMLRQDNTNKFVLIHPSVESKFIVKNMNDVYDFKFLFPESSYTEDVVKQVLNASNLDNIKELSDIYPQYNDQIKDAYLRTSLAQSNSFAQFKGHIDRFPESFAGVDLNIRYTDEAQLKKLFAQLDSYTELMGKDRLRKYKNELLDPLPVITTDIDPEYEELVYFKVDATNYEALYKYVARFPNGLRSNEAKTKADELKYALYLKEYNGIQQEMANVENGIINRQFLSTSALQEKITKFERFGSYDPDNVKEMIVSAKHLVKHGTYVQISHEIKQEVVSILQGFSENRFAGASNLRSKIERFKALEGYDPDYMTGYVENASKLCIVLDGVNKNIPNSYTSSIGGFSGFLLNLLDKPTTSVDVDRAEADQQILVNAMKAAVNLELHDAFGQEALFHKIVLDLHDKEAQLVAVANNNVTEYNRRVDALNARQQSYSQSSSGSYSSGGSSIDVETITIPSYTEGRWSNIGYIDTESKCFIEFKDGTSGTLFNDKENQKGNYYVSTGGSSYVYKTKKDAIDALYAYKKYDKIRKTGKK